jgi:sensor histidine kinase YesM
MTFLIDETIGNAVASYRLKKRATPINLKVVCKQKMYNHEEVIELCISNEGTHLSTDTLASLGTNTVKSRHKGTGFGLYFLNTALDIYDAHIVDNENERYFLPDCENGVVSFKFIFKTNK